MKLSYAQNLEDVYLDRLFEDQPNGRYVDVGGGHPVADNVSFHAYLRGWQGLVVEPQIELADLYRSIRPRDEVISTLAGRAAGTLTFHEIEGLHGFSTAMAENAARAVGDDGRMRTSTRPVERLDAMVRSARLDQIDFLKIDVEGAEADVIAGLGLDQTNAIRPRVILVEAIEPGTMRPAWSGWEPLLTENGYDFAFFDNLNRYYVAREARTLAQRFPDAPLPWDSVQHLWDMGRVHQRPDHPDRQLAELLIHGFMAELPKFAPATLANLIARGRAAQIAKDASVQATPLSNAILGAAEQPARDTVKTLPKDVVELLDTDHVRAALGRIASMYDGGHLM